MISEATTAERMITLFVSDSVVAEAALLLPGEKQSKEQLAGYLITRYHKTAEIEIPYRLWYCC